MILLTVKELKLMDVLSIVLTETLPLFGWFGRAMLLRCTLGMLHFYSDGSHRSDPINSTVKYNFNKISKSEF
jgi:hypothetical protein